MTFNIQYAFEDHQDRPTCLRKILSSSVQQFMSYHQCLWFRTTINFDWDYLWKAGSYLQGENGVIN